MARLQMVLVQRRYSLFYYETTVLPNSKINNICPVFQLIFLDFKKSELFSLRNERTGICWKQVSTNMCSQQPVLAVGDLMAHGICSKLDKDFVLFTNNSTEKWPRFH